MSVCVGSQGVGSKNLCKTNETQRAHRQRKSFAVEQRWYPGMCFCLRPGILQNTEMSLMSFQHDNCSVLSITEDVPTRIV